jgi:SPP1 gp7 family putative phage head morphogenesis protein
MGVRFLSGRLNMKNFRVPPKTNAWIKKKYSRKRRVINKAVEHMEAVMLDAIQYILDHWDGTDRFPEPTLNGMYGVSENFYRDVNQEAVLSAKEKVLPKNGKKKLARSLPSLERTFRDKRRWPKTMKRSKILTDRLRKQYTQKLREKFAEIVPAMKDGSITPMEAKKEMIKSWDASKARVETIFRTETTNYFGKAQVEFFEDDPEIIGFLFDSLKDSASTNICRSRHGLIYKPGSKLLADNTPALHWNCRSHLIPLVNTPENRKMVSDPSRDPSKKSVVPLPKNWRK